MAETSKANILQNIFNDSGLSSVFIEGLGWSSPTAGSLPLVIDNEHLSAEQITQLKGFSIFTIQVSDRPSRSLMRNTDSSIAKLFPERLEIFQYETGWTWHWPKRTNSGSISFESIETLPHTLPLFLCQRLAGLEFTPQEHSRGFTIGDVKNKIHGHFDASNVTKTFFEQFKKQHTNLAAAIEGISDEDASNYSTTLLNRLMFLYFLQKKQFLNNDPNYLENTLKAVQQIEGRDKYFSFYRDALLPLFFEKLNERNGTIADPQIVSVLGDIPYINGGLFGKNDLENAHFEELNVPDDAFESIFKFFSAFNWHLDTRPTGNPNEINPEVIGYIFEQYINYSTSGKKENGAYYTPHDVTAYMVGQTVVPRIFDDFSHWEEAKALLINNPDRYIEPLMLHGWMPDSAAWTAAPAELEECWNEDPLHWPKLDRAELDVELCLPGETWVEMFHRRERVEVLRGTIISGGVTNPNDLITLNLNSQLLLCDAIDDLKAGSHIAETFDLVSNLTVIDPTCGSGAFLFAALEVLEDIYAHLIDGARQFNDTAVQPLLSAVNENPNTQYFIRKHCAIRNLYGTDLMPGAIETAKLRIFLALASCVDQRSELKPLPDLDFNLKAGNLVVGFKDAQDVERFGGDLVAQTHLMGLAPRIDEYEKQYDEFVEAVENDDPRQSELKRHLLSIESALRVDCDRVYADVLGIEPNKFENWVHEANPFHWFCEFPEIIRSGGFSVVIGNPPYVRMSTLPKYTHEGYKTGNCPDLFAICYERSLSLTARSGRHAFIVMLNLSFSEDFSSLRQVISDRDGSEWWTTYGKRPDSLFAGVQVVNTLLIIGPGEQKHSSKHNVFSKASRESLFQTLEMVPLERNGTEQPLRAGIANGLLRSIAKKPLPAAGDSSGKLFFRPTARYWFPVLFSQQPVLDEKGNVKATTDHRLREIKLSDNEQADLVGSALAGKIGFLSWSAYGDDFDVNLDEADPARRLVASITSHSSQIFTASKKVKDAGRETAFVSSNKDGYINVRWNSVRTVTDEFDKELLELTGLEEHWRPLNIWYRQCMRATRENTNSRRLTKAEIDSYLKW